MLVQTTMKRGLNSFKLYCTYSHKPVQLDNYCGPAVPKTLAFSWADLLFYVSQLNISWPRGRESRVLIQFLNMRGVTWVAMDICWNNLMAQKHSFTSTSLPVSLVAKVLARDWEFKYSHFKYLPNHWAK